MIDKILQSPLNEIIQGYHYDEIHRGYTCLICSEFFQVGKIYPIEGELFEASLAVKIHLEKNHHGMFNYLLSLDRKYAGLTDKQMALISDLRDNLSDDDISKKNNTSKSTIRHQRFSLREKAKQAKLFLAMYESLESNDSTDLIDTHLGAKMVDERYVLTQDEQVKIINHYFDSITPMVLKNFPSKEKKKIPVLRKITEAFDDQKKYTELEMNEILSTIYSDVATIRRYLIQYGFFMRTKDGKAYWKNL
jgi:hypothetical protein